MLSANQTIHHRRTPLAARLGTCVASWLALLFCAAGGVAQQSPPNLGEASLEELGNIQVYSASKHMQSTHDAPSSVTVVTADEIQKYGYRNLADILRSVPGKRVSRRCRHDRTGGDCPWT
jgi:outer membrane receptor for ferrienterochelin and colicin